MIRVTRTTAKNLKSSYLKTIINTLYNFTQNYFNILKESKKKNPTIHSTLMLFIRINSKCKPKCKQIYLGYKIEFTH